MHLVAIYRQFIFSPYLLDIVEFFHTLVYLNTLIMFIIFTIFLKSLYNSIEEHIKIQISTATQELTIFPGFKLKYRTFYR